MESEPRKYGCTCHVADRNSIRLMTNPPIAAANRATPSSVPIPTPISSNAMPTPVSHGAWPSTRSSGPIGLPFANAWSWLPM
jgi:hypothetical protein